MKVMLDTDILVSTFVFKSKIMTIKDFLKNIKNIKIAGAISTSPFHWTKLISQILSI